MAAKHLSSHSYTMYSIFSNDNQTGGKTNSSDIIRVVAANNLSYVVDNVAASLTNLAFEASDETVAGDVYTSETFVLVRWEWLILPVIQVSLGVLFLLTIIIRTSVHGSSLWRTSLLPLVYHTLDADTAILDQRPAPNDIATMELKARKVQAQLDTFQKNGKSQGEARVSMLSVSDAST